MAQGADDRQPANAGIEDADRGGVHQRKCTTALSEIMKRCDGARDIAAIVAELEQAFSASGLEGDVLAFVEMAGQQRWLAWN